jgi:hypothetical protein
MAYLSEAKSKSLPLNEFMRVKKHKKSASEALKDAKKRKRA